MDIRKCPGGNSNGGTRDDSRGGTMAKECSPLWRTAVFSFSGAFCENASTLPVPLSGSNDWAKAGVAMTVSNTTVLRNFFCRFSSI
jgi:hypothetical protein